MLTVFKELLKLLLSSLNNKCVTMLMNLTETITLKLITLVHSQKFHLILKISLLILNMQSENSQSYNTLSKVNKLLLKNSLAPISITKMVGAFKDQFQEDNLPHVVDMLFSVVSMHSERRLKFRNHIPIYPFMTTLLSLSLFG